MENLSKKRKNGKDKLKSKMVNVTIRFSKHPRGETGIHDRLKTCCSGM